MNIDGVFLLYRLSNFEPSYTYLIFSTKNNPCPQAACLSHGAYQSNRHVSSQIFARCWEKNVKIRAMWVGFRIEPHKYFIIFFTLRNYKNKKKCKLVEMGSNFSEGHHKMRNSMVKSRRVVAKYAFLQKNYLSQQAAWPSHDAYQSDVLSQIFTWW